MVVIVAALSLGALLAAAAPAPVDLADVLAFVTVREVAVSAAGPPSPCAAATSTPEPSGR